MELSMAKLKIQSAEDIVSAYLQCLGIKKTEASPFLNAYSKLENSANLTAELDEVVYQKAKKIFKNKLAKPQLTALYKAVFIELNLAQKFGIKPLLPDFNDAEFIKLMQQSFIEVAPTYKMTAMPTQEISTIHLHKQKK